MAGNAVQILGACRVSTVGGVVAVVSQSGMFDSGAWVYTAVGRFTCTLGGGAQAQNTLDNVATCILIEVEDTRIDRGFMTNVDRISNTVFEVAILSTTTVGVTALDDPDTGFTCVALTYP